MKHYTPASAASVPLFLHPHAAGDLWFIKAANTGSGRVEVHSNIWFQLLPK